MLAEKKRHKIMFWEGTNKLHDLTSVTAAWCYHKTIPSHDNREPTFQNNDDGEGYKLKQNSLFSGITMYGIKNKDFSHNIGFC